MFLYIIVFLVSILCIYVTRSFKYWKDRGVKTDTPFPLIGNCGKIYTMQMSAAELAADVYKRYPNEKVVGLYRAHQPVLLIRDPEIIKRVMVTDFAHFYPRGLVTHKEVIEPLLRNLFFADGDIWRLLRQRMTPAFSSGKLKAMFPLISERAEKLQDRTLQAASAGRVMDARDLMARYTTDFIGACAFGLESDALSDENSSFRRLGVEIFRVGFQVVFTVMMKEIFPNMCKNLKYLGKIERQLIDLVNEVQKQRNYEPSDRNDFIDLLLECKKKGKIVGESISKRKPDGTPEEATLELNEEIFAAQVFVFFAAGFETSSSATSYTLHLLAYHPDIQQKVQDEIDRVLAKYDNKLCYDAVKEMTYLECAFKEALRIFPSLGYLMRECAREYTLEDLDFTIDPGVAIIIPVFGLHHDPQYFDKPEEFRPERFYPENFDSNKNKFNYLPFGEGPRACIGLRLGVMQSLAGLAALLAKFTIEPAPQSKRIPRIEPTSGIVQNIRGGLPLYFRERRK